MTTKGKSIRRFTAEEVRCLTEQWLSYVPAEQIAKNLGRNVGTIIQKARGLKLHRNPLVSRILKWAPEELVNKLKDGMNPDTFVAACYQWRLEEQGKLKELKAQELALHQQELARKATEIDSMPLTKIGKMTAKRVAGLTLEEIGRQHGGLTRERVRQLTSPDYARKVHAPGRPRNPVTPAERLAQLAAERLRIEEQALAEFKALWRHAPSHLRSEFLNWVKEQTYDEPAEPTGSHNQDQ